MRMGRSGLVSARASNFRAVFVFDRAALERFLDVGVSIGEQADAAAKAGDLGAAVSGEAIVDNVTVYQLTQSGLALQATSKALDTGATRNSTALQDRCRKDANSHQRHIVKLIQLDRTSGGISR